MQKIELKIHLYGEKSLRKKSVRVKSVSRGILDLREKMAQIMYAGQGVGLAAPQVGINKQIILVDIGEGLVTLVNPKVKKRQGQSVMEEGCLSLPGVTVKVRRANKIFVEALNESGKMVKFWAEDLLARVILHENDHLKGKLIVDYANFLRRLKIRKEFKELLKQKGVKHVHMS